MLTLESVPWYAHKCKCACTLVSGRRRFPGGKERFAEANRGFRAGVAQLVEHLICNQRVGGSNPFASSIHRGLRRSGTTASSFTGAPSWSSGPVLCGNPHEVHAPKYPKNSGSPGSVRAESNAQTGFSGWTGVFAQVAEWLMAADCKSAAPWSYGGSNPPLCTRFHK